MERKRELFECPVCGQETVELDSLADHIMRAHWALPLGYPPRKLQSASYKRDGFGGFYCWCGDAVAVVLSDDGRAAFIEHCDGKGGIDAHLFALMLGIDHER